jgi:hypothetical protein
MRGVLAPIAAVFCSLFSGTYAPAALAALSADADDRTYEVSVDALFTPEGYAADEDAQVVVLGTLRQPCDELLEPRVVADEGQKAVGITLTARAVDGPCILETTGVDRSVFLGQLAEGQYSVIANNGWLVEELRIAPALRGEPGAPARAFVEEAWVEHVPADPDAVDARDAWFVILRGRVPECADVGTIKVMNSGETVEVLPYLGPRQELEGPKQDRCGPAGRLYWKRVELPVEGAGKTLVQVRGAGDAINIVIDADE